VPEREAGRDREDDREGEYPAVDRDLIQARQVGGRDRDQ
jgi:hypothetical protein